MDNKQALSKTKLLIDLIIEATGKTKYAIAKETGINQSAMGRYAAGASTPSLDALMRLSRYAAHPLVARWFAETFSPDR